MRITANRARVDRITLRLMLHLRAGEKVGLSSFMALFPAAALDDLQREIQKEKGKREVKYNRPGVDDPAREILHVFNQPDVGKNLGAPFRSAGHRDREVAEHEERNAERKTDDGGNDLIARGGRSEAAECHVEATPQEDSKEGGRDRAEIHDGGIVR